MAADRSGKWKQGKERVELSKNDQAEGTVDRKATGRKSDGIFCKLRTAHVAG